MDEATIEALRDEIQKLRERVEKLEARDDWGDYWTRVHRVRRAG